MGEAAPGNAPKIDIKNGTTIPGYGESLTVNIVTGAPSLSIPLPLSEVRGQAPQLGLNYGGTVQNGPFGIGFSLGFSSIARRTDKGIPRYDDRDVMLLDGEQLTPRYVRDGGGWRPDARAEDGFRVRGYRPRVESAFSHIEWWQRLDGTASHWKVVDGQNVVSVYGESATARVADSEDATRIFEWLLEWREDARGNRIEARYKAEDATGVPPSLLSGVGPQKYLQSVRYGNYRRGTETAFAVELLFDYGEYDLATRSPEPVRPWPARRDPFIGYRTGFPVTVARLCRNILTVHRFPDEADVGVTVVGVTAFSYREELVCSRLTASQRHGYRRLKDGSAWTQSLPPMRFQYGADDLSTSTARPLEVAGRAEFPAASPDASVQLVDLLGEGIPGVLYADGTSVVYWPPEGEGHYGEAGIPSQFPNLRSLGGGTNLLADIRGNGHKDLMVRNAGMSGFFANRNDGGWEPFEPFAATPTELTDPAAELTDLSGSGRQDLWIPAGEERLRVYGSRGAAGYQGPVERTVAADFPSGPSGEDVYVGFADIFGDGLNHRVEVRDRSVSVWPSLGYGRFGARRQLANPPPLGATTASRIFFADVDGSGFDALILVDGFSVRVCRNLCGRGFADPVRLDLPVAADDTDQILLADVEGVGRQALVVVKVGAETRGYYMPMAEGAPLRVVAFENGFGRRCEIDYRSSTDFYLADRRLGRPWRGKVPFPLLLVARLTSFDEPTGRTVTTCYEYGEGYYDPTEREFAGFGHVRSRDTQLFSPADWRGEAASSPGGGVQPLVTETWTQTGQPFPDEPGGSLAPDVDGARIVPADVLAADIWAAGGEAVREAFRALRGRQAATQESGVSPAGEVDPVPFVVQGQNYRVAMLQPPIDGYPGVFLVSARESRAYRFEGVRDDPRVQQTAVIETDAFGNVTRSASVLYPRRPAAAAVPGQEIGSVTAGLGDFANHPFTAAERYNRIGVGWRERQFEIHGIALAAGRPLAFDDLKSAVDAALAPERRLPYGTPFSGPGLASRLLGDRRTRFWDEAGAVPAPYGVVGPRALERDTQSAVFPDAFVKALFGARVDDALLAPSGGAGAGYLLDAGTWWQTSAVTHYGGADAYFVATRTVDPFGAATAFAYDDYAIAITAIEDALGFRSTCRTDYQTLLPRQTIDPNGITLEALYGPLGKIAAVSRYGALEGRRIGDASLADYVPVPDPSLEDMLADPEKYLQGAGSYYFEDLGAWAGSARPAYSVLLEADDEAERAPAGGIVPRPVAIGLSFVDGSTSVIARQEQVERAAVEPQFLPGGDAQPAGDWCWITRDQVVRDEKDQVVTQYTPYVTLDPGYVVDPQVPAFRNSYDAVGRIVRVDTPKGFFTKTIYSAWSTVYYDEDDTVRESRYYKEHIDDTSPGFADERDALVKSAALADTPTTTFVDPRGDPIVERRQLIEAGGEGTVVPAPDTDTSHGTGTSLDTGTLLDTGTWRDALGRVVRQADPRFYNAGRPERFNLDLVLDMLGRTLAATSTDRGKAEPGTRFVLTDTSGQRLCEWDNAGTLTRQAFDPLRRMVAQRVTKAGAAFVALTTEYGTAADTNSIGKVVVARSQAAVSRSELFDLLGNALEQTRQYVARNDGRPVDWTDPGMVALSPTVWPLAASYNRRGWPVSETNADGSRVSIRYFATGWRRELSLEEGGETATVASGLRYNPRADVVAIETANGVATRRTYDDRTLRLAGTTSVRGRDGAVLFDERYFYDAVGNVTRVRDAAGTTEFFANGAAEPLDDYSYDSLYRLVAATGRQQAGMARSRQAATGRQVDPERLVGCRRRFAYDTANNLLEIRHAAGEPADGWTRRIAVSPTSNHAVPEKMIDGGRTPDDFFDENGNLAALNALHPLAFDYAGRLACSDIVDRREGENDRVCYAYDAADTRWRKTEYRLAAGNDNPAATETFYIGNLAVVSSAGGEASVLRVYAGADCVLHVERSRPGGGGTPSSQRRYPLANRQRSITRETDEDGNVVRLEAYFPYGGTAYRDGTGSGGPVRYGFVGQELDQTTGFYLMGRRYYCPYLARWLTPDPDGASDGLNLYAYVNDNPTSLIDPSGTNGVEVRGTPKQVQDYEQTVLADHQRAVAFVQGTINALRHYLEPKTREDVQAKVAPALETFFNIKGTSETDLNDIREILSNYQKLYGYLNQDKPETRGEKLRSWFVDVPLYRIRPPDEGTLAFVQGANPYWPDYGIVPRSLRSRPLATGWAGVGLFVGGVALFGGGFLIGGTVGLGVTLVGELVGGLTLVSGSINAVRRLLPRSGINLHENQFTYGGDGGVAPDRFRSATIVHESSHLVLGTADHAYKFEAKFDTLSTTQRMNNADSYGLFSEAVTR